MKVFILATCRDVSLLKFTTLVFDSIRVGFPTAEIIVTGNALPDYALEAVTEASRRTNCVWRQATLNWEPTIHHVWLENLCDQMMEPFWICDTDMIFYESVEGWKFDRSLAGWRIPEWNDEAAGARTRARLHTSLLYIDPVKLRADIAAYHAKFPVTVFNPMVNLFHPLCLPFKGEGTFYDTAGLLYHAVGGQSFTDRQLEAFFHFHFGTISDMVIPRLKDGAVITAARAAIMANPILGKGAWRAQTRYYEDRQQMARLRDWPGPLQLQAGGEDPRHRTSDIKDFCLEVCKSDIAALQFCDLWFNYSHRIDDLLDTREDGRPTMSSEDVLSIFATGLMLYNCEFYLKHQKHLFPVVLLCTNAFADSVEWEKAPVHRRRVIADVLRCCGNEMFFLVATLTGGYSHMRDVSARIRESSWLLQHDENDQPN